MTLKRKKKNARQKIDLLSLYTINHRRPHPMVKLPTIFFMLHIFSTPLCNIKVHQKNNWMLVSYFQLYDGAYILNSLNKNVTKIFLILYFTFLYYSCVSLSILSLILDESKNRYQRSVLLSGPTGQEFWAI